MEAYIGLKHVRRRRDWRLDALLRSLQQPARLHERCSRLLDHLRDLLLDVGSLLLLLDLLLDVGSLLLFLDVLHDADVGRLALILDLLLDIGRLQLLLDLLLDVGSKSSSFPLVQLEVKRIELGGSVDERRWGDQRSTGNGVSPGESNGCLVQSLERWLETSSELLR